MSGPVIVVATAIVRGATVLAQQRAYPAADAGRWEFPGGRVEPGESEPDAVRRECLEELGVRVRPGARIGPAVHPRPELELRLWSAEPVDATPPAAAEHLAVRWVPLDRLARVDWLDADRAFLPAVRALLG